MISLQDGQCETFRTLYSDVGKIELAAPSKYNKTSVTAQLLSPPIVGRMPASQPPNSEGVVMSFDLSTEDVERFVQALKSRGLVSIPLPSPRLHSLTRCLLDELDCTEGSQVLVCRISFGVGLRTRREKARSFNPGLHDHIPTYVP